ncbi:MAG: adenylosuccinate lyase [Phototrophicaceae bacterium]
MSIRAISPIDGRYHSKTLSLSDYFSEYALMKYRVTVEIAWLKHLSQVEDIPEVRALTESESDFLQDIVSNFDDAEAEKIKATERKTNHDVKAVEYYVKDCLADTSLADLSEFVHFACTSEDINNLSHAMMLRDGLMDVWLQEANDLVGTVADKAELLRDVAILAHTHGQPASPTTMGKELAVYVYRWQRQLTQLENQQYLGKFSGAVGAFNAHLSAYPDADWLDISRTFVENFGLTFNPLTTQIESHDYLAETFHILNRFNAILLDFCRDMWTYISMGYFKQRTVAGEIGSSTMPHKVNPIDFENAEANVGLSNSILSHLADKLMVSRLQRDLSDSSALRNLGVGIAHSHIALQSALRGVNKVDINETVITDDLNHAWEVLAEPIQTVLRKVSYPNPYEKLKELTRGVAITQAELQAFVDTLPISEEDKARLRELSPASYTGMASDLVDFIGE